MCRPGSGGLSVVACCSYPPVVAHPWTSMLFNDPGHLFRITLAPAGREKVGVVHDASFVLRIVRRPIRATLMLSVDGHVNVPSAYKCTQIARISTTVSMRESLLWLPSQASILVRT